MTNYPADMLAHLAQNCTTVCHAWRLTRRDGTVRGFTDHDMPLTVDGTVAGLTRPTRSHPISGRCRRRSI